MQETKMKHVKLTHEDGEQVLTGWVREAEIAAGGDYRLYSEDTTNATKWALTVFNDHSNEWTVEEIKPTLQEILDNLGHGSVIKETTHVPFFKLEDGTWVGTHNRDKVYTAKDLIKLFSSNSDRVQILLNREKPVWA